MSERVSPHRVSMESHFTHYIGPFESIPGSLGEAQAIDCLEQLVPQNAAKIMYSQYSAAAAPRCAVCSIQMCVVSLTSICR